MNSPVSSLNAISTPRSPGCFGSRIASLLVPTMTTPSATVGLPYDCDPSSATHFTFLPVLMSHEVGRPFMSDTMLRLGVPPHIGQSFGPSADTVTAIPAAIASEKTIDVRIRISCWPVRLLACWPTDFYRPSHCRNRLRKSHPRKYRDFPSCVESCPPS